MSTRPRVLLAAFGGVLGHVARLLVVADAITARTEGDADLMLVGAERFTDVARTRPVTCVDDADLPLDLWGIENPSIAARILGTWFRRRLADDLAALRTLEPDVVVIDGRWPTLVAARQLGIPAVVVTNVFWTRHRPVLALDHEPVFVWFSTFFGHAVGPTMASLDHPIASDLEAFQAGDHVHLADIGALLGAATPALPNTTVGPLLWWPDDVEPVDWPAGDGPTAYMTAGSTGLLDAIEPAAEHLARAGWRVVLSGAPRPSTSPNLVRVPMCDPQRLLATADVAIGHSGNGSIAQALAHGVPVVACPANLDQAANGELLARSGAGLRVASLPTKSLGAQMTRAECADIVAAAERVRDDESFSAHARAIAETMRPGNDDVADAALAFATRTASVT